MAKKNTVIFSMAHNNIKKWLTNPRIYLIVVLLVAYFHSRISPIYMFCESYDVRISPFIFPYFMSDRHVVLITSLAAMLLFCDAPFIDSEQPYIVLRSGRKKWIFGQLVYIAISSILLTLYFYLLTILLLLPRIELSNEWGKVIGTFVQTTTGDEYNITIFFDSYIFFGYSPIKATLISLLLCFSVVFFMGVLMFYINLRTNRTIGTIVSGILILWQLVISKTSTYWVKASPLSWIKLGNIDIDGSTVYPDLTYVMVGLYGMTIIFAILSVLIMRKRDIDVLKSV
jgi:hypothetical protein